MWAGETCNGSRNQFLWKTLSHESVFQSSPPKSFAEEVANELCNRAKNLGSSHPSVITGKQKRIMDGLMNVAEAIRKDFPQPSNVPATSTSPKSRFSLMYTAELRDNAKNESDGASIFRVLGDAEVNSNISETDFSGSSSFQKEPFQDSDSQISENEPKLEISTISASGDSETELPSIHLRLAIDHSENNNLPWTRNNMHFSEDEVISSTPKRVWKPPKRKRFHKAKKNSSLIHFFQSMCNKKKKKKSKSEKNLKFRERVLAILNNNTFKNFRKSVQDSWRTKRQTESKLPDFKNIILKKFKN